MEFHMMRIRKLRNVASNFLDIPVVGLHSFENQHKAIADAQAIFVGGGNTFVLVDELYKRGVFSELQEVIESGTPYLGTSAGSNICGLSMQNYE